MQDGKPEQIFQMWGDPQKPLPCWNDELLLVPQQRQILQQNFEHENQGPEKYMP